MKSFLKFCNYFLVTISFVALQATQLYCAGAKKAAPEIPLRSPEKAYQFGQRKALNVATTQGKEAGQYDYRTLKTKIKRDLPNQDGLAVIARKRSTIQEAENFYNRKFTAIDLEALVEGYSNLEAYTKAYLDAYNAAYDEAEAAAQKR